jgi:hypothetical protein
MSARCSTGKGQNISHRMAPVGSCKGYQSVMCTRVVAASSCSGFTICQICGILGPCPNPPAAAKLNGRTAGKSVTARCAPTRSRVAACPRPWDGEHAFRRPARCAMRQRGT